mgnify:CR=1 FL=1
MIGAERCELGRSDCNEGCARGAKYKGTKVSNISNSKDHIDNSESMRLIMQGLLIWARFMMMGSCYCALYLVSCVGVSGLSA